MLALHPGNLLDAWWSHPSLHSHPQCQAHHLRGASCDIIQIFECPCWQIAGIVFLHMVEWAVTGMLALHPGNTPDVWQRGETIVHAFAHWD